MELFSFSTPSVLQALFGRAFFEQALFDDQFFSMPFFGMHFFQAFFSSKKCIKVYFYTEVAKKAEFFGPFGCSKLGKSA